MRRASYCYYHLLPIGRPQEAVDQLERALEDDPLNTQARAVSAVCLVHLGRYEDASAECRRVLEVDDGSWQAYAVLALIHHLQGMAAAALACAEKAYSSWNPISIGLLAGILVSNGNRSRAEEVIQKLKDAPESYGAPRGLCAFYFLSGDGDRAADWVEKSIEQREPWLRNMRDGTVGSVSVGHAWRS